MGNGLVQATPFISLPQSGGLAPYVRVIMVAGELALAGANDRELGTTDYAVPASGLGTSSLASVVDRKAHGTVRMVANGTINQYARVYGAASGLVSATANGNFIGYAITSASANGDWIEVLRAADDQNLLYSSLAATAALTNTTAETDFGDDFTFPANMLRAGDVIEILATGTVTGVASTPTLNVKLELASQLIVATGAVTVTAAGLFVVEAQLVVQTAGSGGTFGARGQTTIGVPGTAVPTPFRLATTTALNTTIAQLLKLTGTWSAASASDTAVLDSMTVKRFAA